MPRLLIIFLVLSLSTRAGQKKIFCLPWQEVFHNHLKIGSAWEWLVSVLYALEGEKFALPQMYAHVSFDLLRTMVEWIRAQDALPHVCPVPGRQSSRPHACPVPEVWRAPRVPGSERSPAGPPRPGNSPLQILGSPLQILGCASTLSPPILPDSVMWSHRFGTHKKIEVLLLYDHSFWTLILKSLQIPLVFAIKFVLVLVVS